MPKVPETPSQLSAVLESGCWRCLLPKHVELVADASMTEIILLMKPLYKKRNGN